MFFWTQIYNFLAVQIIYTNNASDVMLISYILGLSSIFIYFFADRWTLIFLKVWCNPTNRKIMALVLQFQSKQFEFYSEIEEELANMPNFPAQFA